MTNYCKVLVISLLCVCSLFFSLRSFGQKKDIKIVKVNSANYPSIELYVKSAQIFDTARVRIIEQGEERKFTADTLSSNKIQEDLNILFSVDYSLREELFGEWSEIFKHLPVGSKINIAYRFPVDTTQTRLVYLNSEFSKNYPYFQQATKINMADSKFLLSKDYNCEDLQKAEQFLIAEASEQKTALIHILSGKESFRADCSHLLSNHYGAAYIVVLATPDEQSQKEMIQVCNSSGGMFTICRIGEVYKTLCDYLEDIDAQGFTEGKQVHCITFETQQGEGNNDFDLYYDGQRHPLHFVAGGKPQRTLTEIILLFSTVILTLLLFFTQYKRLFGKGFKAKKPKPQLTAPTVVPIEINVRTQGFNKNYFFEKYFISIGRDIENDIAIPDTTVSSTHAVINREKGGFFVQDTGSTNGVLLNEKKIEKKRLHSGDKLKLGGAILIVIFQ